MDKRSKLLFLEQEWILCSALKSRVAIFAKRRAPMVKPARVWPLGTSRTHLTKKGWVLLHQFKKKLVVEYLTGMINQGGDSS